MPALFISVQLFFKLSLANKETQSPQSSLHFHVYIGYHQHMFILVITSTCLYWLPQAHVYIGYHKHMFILVITSTCLYWLSLAHVYIGYHQHMFILVTTSTCLYWLSLAHIYIGYHKHMFILVITSTCLCFYFREQERLGKYEGGNLLRWECICRT